MRIAVLGLGYVGLSTSVAFALLGQHVAAYDSDVERMHQLESGSVPIYEPGLTEALAGVVEKNALEFASDLESAVSGSAAVFVAVGTPPGIDGRPDLSYLLSLADELAPQIRDNQVVVLKSTAPPGTDVEFMKQVRLAREKAGLPSLSLKIAVNPEFLREGKALEDSMHPARIVIGLSNSESRPLLEGLYSGFAAPIVWTDPTSAALIKYASNCFLATKISFVNEMARLCSLAGGNIDDVSRGMGMDPRIGNQFLRAGIGYGGSCFPKDTLGLLSIGDDLGYVPRIVRATIDVNNDQPGLLIRQLSSELGDLRSAHIAVLGLAFKADTDDIRESVGIRIANELMANGAIVAVHDYRALKSARKELSCDVRFCADVDAAVHGAVAVIVTTEWPGYAVLDWKHVATLMSGKLILDGRNFLSPPVIARAGLTYLGVGRPARRGLGVEVASD